MSGIARDRPPGLLGDTTLRDYSAKLARFNRFAEPELRKAIDALSLRPRMRVLDAGCGTGEALQWLSERVGSNGLVVGMDLATAHVAAARGSATAGVLLLQADLRHLPLLDESFDVVWSVNTIHHVPDPLGAVRSLSALLRRDGRIVLGQSAFLPDMVFSWDARLERLVTEAVRQYYRERYGLEERDLAGVRGTAGLLRRAGLSCVNVQTQVIERLFPLAAVDRAYLLETVFRDTWGERLRPYLAAEDFAALSRACDPKDPEFALDRPDFHLIQTLTFATGSR